MALRVRTDRRIFCAVLSKEEDGDLYVDDAIHYLLAVEQKVIVTTAEPEHSSGNGEWWWTGEEPKDVKIDEFYYT